MESDVILMYCKVVSYTGTGASQHITFGWEPDGVVIYKLTLQAGLYMHSTPMPVNAYAQIVGSQLAYFTGAPTYVPSLDSTGCNVGTDMSVNAAKYAAIAFKAAASKDFGCVVWTGNGADNRNITGLGFQPDFIEASGNNATKFQRAWHSLKGGDQSLAYAAGQGWLGNSIQSVGADGFQVGTDMNQNGNIYHAMCWKATAGSSEIGTFTGANGALDRTITPTTIIDPVFVFDIATDTGSNQGSIFFRSTANTLGSGKGGGINETTQTVKTFTTTSFVCDKFMNSPQFTHYWIAFSAQDPSAAAAAPLPELISGGAGGIVPFAPYQRYKSLRALGQQLNNVVLGP
jgi:hypothetical protein